MINWRRWLGLRCDQVERMLGRKTSPLDPALIQSLSAVDKKKIKSMLASDPVQNMPKYVRELEIMLAGNVLFFSTSHYATLLVLCIMLRALIHHIVLVISTSYSCSIRHCYSSHLVAQYDVM